MSEEQMNKNIYDNTILMFTDLYEKAKATKGGQEYWHYTSGTAILKIFDDYVKNQRGNAVSHVDRCSFLASNIRYMNDSQEFEVGRSYYLKKQNNSRKEGACKTSLTSDIYLISFCGSGDLLSQWKWYGKQSGVSICFNLDSVEYNTYSSLENGKTSGPEDSVESNEFYEYSTRPLPVCYTNAEKDAYYDKVNNPLYQIGAGTDKKAIEAAFVPFCKHVGFQEEAESRLVFYTYKLEYGSFNFQYNTSEPERIKPALLVKFRLHHPANAESDRSAAKSYNSAAIPPNIISKMIVGPGRNQNLVFNFLIHLFDRTNYRFHEENAENKAQSAISITDFYEKARKEHNVYYVNWPVKQENDKMIARASYLCENGIVIMKSSTPFRG